MGYSYAYPQCIPCPICYPQNAEFFNPEKSPAYMGVSDDSKLCTFLPKGDDRCGISNE